MKYLIVLFAVFLAGCATESPKEKQAREIAEGRVLLCIMNDLTFVSEYHEAVRWPSRSHRIIYGSVCRDLNGKRIVIKSNGRPYGQ